MPPKFSKTCLVVRYNDTLQSFTPSKISAGCSPKWTTYLLLKRQAETKIWMKGICYDIIPNLGSSAGYLEKQPHNRMIDSYWPKNTLPWNKLNATNRCRISIKCLIPYQMFGYWTAGVKIKTSIPLVQVMTKKVWHCSTEVGELADWSPKFLLYTSKLQL